MAPQRCKQRQCEDRLSPDPLSHPLFLSSRRHTQHSAYEAKGPIRGANQQNFLVEFQDLTGGR